MGVDISIMIIFGTILSPARYDQDCKSPFGCCKNKWLIKIWLNAKANNALFFKIKCWTKRPQHWDV